MTEQKKVISFSLWGDNPKYTHGAIKNAVLARRIYPDWECWFYVADNVPTTIIDSLAIICSARVIKMGKGDWTSMFWRFLPANKNLTMISRDTDSRLSMREKLAVDEWLASDKDFHIMRDHPYHATEIMGGMWGARNGVLKGKIGPAMVGYKKGDFWQVDQDFLKERVFPLIRNNALIHDPFFHRYNFPSPRAMGEYVGKAYNSDDTECEPELSKLVYGAI